MRFSRILFCFFIELKKGLEYSFENTFIRDPYYYLFYSGDGKDIEHYHVGVSRSKSIKGPYKKFGKQVLHIDEENYVKGKNTTFVGPGMTLHYII